MDKYRLMYYQNLLGTSDLSTLRFYYASFQIQQNKNSRLDIKDFLLDCTSIGAKKWSVLFLPLNIIPYYAYYKSGQKRISKFINLRFNDVADLFSKRNVDDIMFEQFLYGISNSTLSSSEKIAKVIEKVITYNSTHRKKQLGDRVFGYLLKSELIGVYASPNERLKAWKTYIGTERHPSDISILATPNENRSKIFDKTNKRDTKSLISKLEEIHNFFMDLELPKLAELVQIDLQKLA